MMENTLDRNQARKNWRDLLDATNDTIILPVPVITEVAYLVQKYLGTTAIPTINATNSSCPALITAPRVPG